MENQKICQFETKRLENLTKISKFDQDSNDCSRDLLESQDLVLRVENNMESMMLDHYKKGFSDSSKEVSRVEEKIMKTRKFNNKCYYVNEWNKTTDMKDLTKKKNKQKDSRKIHEDKETIKETQETYSFTEKMDIDVIEHTSNTEDEKEKRHIIKKEIDKDISDRKD